MIAAGLILLGLLGAWELYVVLGGLDPLILPAPHAVASALWNDRSLLGNDLLVTGREIALGIVLAVALGVVCAALVHLHPVLRRALRPLLVASQTMPIPVVAPLLVAWLGFGIAPKLLVIGLICFFPVTVTTLDALESTDPDLLKLMRTLGASRRQAFWRVEAPAALPAAISGARIAVAVAVIAAVLAEQSAGSTAGLGHTLTSANGSLDSSLSWAAVVLLAVLAVLLFLALGALERLALPWTRPSRSVP